MGGGLLAFPANMSSRAAGEFGPVFMHTPNGHHRGRYCAAERP